MSPALQMHLPLRLGEELTDLTTMDVPERAPHWGMLGTVVWGIGIASAFVVLQTIAMVAYVTRGETSFTEGQLQALLEDSQNNGVVLSLATLFSALVCVPLVLGIAKLKRGSRLRQYLALRAVPLRVLGLWLGITGILILVSATLTVLLDRPDVTEFMEIAYASANPAWILWLALVVGAPLFEEVFFRGFLFKGLEGAIKPIGAVFLTAALWAAMHLQYDMYGIGTIFVIGVLLGAARARTDSLLPPLAMHALINVVACAEAAVLANGVVT